ncbi:hypothetical protein LJR230_001123 [Trinickia sp. LjRoot230]|uniref:hypothetical protein n=1 Tax=Trinickia sp. LjRoot230 TaxID=3342288 RepID=UPI003ED043E0
MGSISDVTSSGGFPNNLPGDPSGAGTQPQQQVSPDAPAVFLSSSGTPPARAPGQHANASFRAAGRQAAADRAPYEQVLSTLDAIGFRADHVDEIIHKRPVDAMSTLDILAQVTGVSEPVGINLRHYLTPSQLVMLAASCGASGLRAIDLYRNELGGHLLPKVVEELAKYGNGFEPSLSYRPEKLVQIAAMHGPEALTALREHSEKLQDFGCTQFVLAEVAHQGGADSIEALLAFHTAVHGGHPFSLDELAGIAAKDDDALRTLQHLVQEQRTDFTGMSKLDILRRIGFDELDVPAAARMNS